MLQIPGGNFGIGAVAPKNVRPARSLDGAAGILV